MMFAPSPEQVFVQSIEKVFFDAAQRAFHKRLTARSTLETPAMRAFEGFVKSFPSTMRQVDVQDGIDAEFRRQKEMYTHLEALQEHFRLMNVPYTIEGPLAQARTRWVHFPSYGCRLAIQNSKSFLWAFPTMPANAKYRTLEGKFDTVVWIDKAVTIVLPNVEDNDDLDANERLTAPLRVFDTPAPPQRKGILSKLRSDEYVSQSFEHHPNFILSDVAVTVRSEQIQSFFEKYNVGAVVVADRVHDVVTINTLRDLPRLHKELLILRNA